MSTLICFLLDACVAYGCLVDLARLIFAAAEEKRKNRVMTKNKKKNVVRIEGKRVRERGVCERKNSRKAQSHALMHVVVFVKKLPVGHSRQHVLLERVRKSCSAILDSLLSAQTHSLTGIVAFEQFLEPFGIFQNIIRFLRPCVCIPDMTNGVFLSLSLSLSSLSLSWPRRHATSDMGSGSFLTPEL
jgi:hypothetical protein